MDKHTDQLFNTRTTCRQSCTRKYNKARWKHSKKNYPECSKIYFPADHFHQKTASNHLVSLWHQIKKSSIWTDVLGDDQGFSVEQKTAVQHCLFFPVFSMTNCQYNASHMGFFQGPMYIAKTNPIYMKHGQVKTFLQCNQRYFAEPIFMSISDTSSSSFWFREHW